VTADRIAANLAAPKPFIPSAYAALRTEAVDALREAVEGFTAADDRALGVAIAKGQKVLLQIDALGVVCRV
jgi:hypothetical protein